MVVGGELAYQRDGDLGDEEADPSGLPGVGDVVAVGCRRVSAAAWEGKRAATNTLLFGVAV